ncbi:MAG: hypothetical protein ACI934_000792 [Pseudohongiellaceae bacterium]
MKEKLQEYALLAEVISAIAILISLTFVGLEIRDSNTLAASESLKDATQIWVTEYKINFGTEESSAFMRKALNNYNELTSDEKGRFLASMLGFIAAFDNVYNKYESGLLREDVFKSIALGFYGIATMPGAQQFFENTSPLLFPPYVLNYSKKGVFAEEGEAVERYYQNLLSLKL